MVKFVPPLSNMKLKFSHFRIMSTGEKRCAGTGSIWREEFDAGGLPVHAPLPKMRSAGRAEILFGTTHKESATPQVKRPFLRYTRPVKMPLPLGGALQVARKKAPPPMRKDDGIASFKLACLVVVAQQTQRSLRWC